MKRLLAVVFVVQAVGLGILVFMPRTVMEPVILNVLFLWSVAAFLYCAYRTAHDELHKEFDARVRDENTRREPALQNGYPHSANGKRMFRENTREFREVRAPSIMQKQDARR